MARDAQRASERERSWDGDALRYRDIARSVAKRVLTLTVGLGLVLATGALGLFPVLLPVVCKSPEVALLVSNVRAAECVVCCCDCRHCVLAGLPSACCFVEAHLWYSPPACERIVLFIA